MTGQIVDKDPKRVREWSSEHGGAGVAGTAIGLEIDGELIAAVLYDNYNEASVAMHLTIRPGAIVTPQFLWYSFQYPFNEMKVNKVLGYVNEENQKALSLYGRLGFTVEHRIANASPGGDLVVISMTRQQCRFLGVPNEQPKAAAST